MWIRPICWKVVSVEGIFCGKKFAGNFERIIVLEMAFYFLEVECREIMLDVPV